MTKKKKRALIITLIIAIVILIAAGTTLGVMYYLNNRPIVKVNKAIEEKDYRTVSDLYDELKDDEKTEVTNRMAKLSSDLRKEYEQDESRYDYVIEVYDILGEKVLKDNATYKSNVEKVAELKASKDAFANGKSAMEGEEYELAIEYFEQVIKNDSNYDEAQQLIEECRALMPVDIVGTWICKVDCAQVIAKQAGAIGNLIPSLLIPVRVDFDEDGTGMAYISDTDLEDIIQTVTDLAMDTIINTYCKKYGMSESKLNIMTKMLYGKTAREYAKQEIRNTVKNTLNSFDCSFTYENSGKEIVATDSKGGKINLELNGDILLLKDGDSEAVTALKNYEFELPLEFTRSDDTEKDKEDTE